MPFFLNALAEPNKQEDWMFYYFFSCVLCISLNVILGNKITCLRCFTSIFFLSLYLPSNSSSVMTNGFSKYCTDCFFSSWWLSPKKPERQQRFFLPTQNWNKENKLKVARMILRLNSVVRNRSMALADDY